MAGMLNEFIAIQSACSFNRKKKMFPQAQGSVKSTVIRSQLSVKYNYDMVHISTYHDNSSRMIRRPACLQRAIPPQLVWSSLWGHFRSQFYWICIDFRLIFCWNRIHSINTFLILSEVFAARGTCGELKLISLIEMAELFLDPAIRSWVFLPLVIITFLFGVIRHYTTIIFASDKKSELQNISDR